MVKRATFRKEQNRTNQRIKRKTRAEIAAEQLQKLRVDAFCARGASHVRCGIPCQDAANVVAGTAYRIAVIADGHGGADYFRSDRGSRFAVETFQKKIAEAFAPITDHSDDLNALHFKSRTKIRNLPEAVAAARSQKRYDEIAHQLVKSIVFEWNSRVDTDLAVNPVRNDELKNVSLQAKNSYLRGENLHKAYGSTMIGAVMTPAFCLLLQIGDGVCIAFDQNGSPCEPIPVDEKCFLNTTTSICDSHVVKEFRHRLFTAKQGLPAAVFVSSDGIEDCFKIRRDLQNFFRTVILSYHDSSPDCAHNELAEFLPRLSENGSGDDMSLAFIRNSDVFNQIDAFKPKYLKIRASIDDAEPQIFQPERGEQTIEFGSSGKIHHVTLAIREVSGTSVTIIQNGQNQCLCAGNSMIMPLNDGRMMKLECFIG